MQDPERSAPLLAVEDLEIAFRSGGRWLPRASGVSFDVRPGEIVALVGESGCGKSITALSILRLLSEQARVTRGDVRWQGQSLTALSEEALDRIRGAEIAMIFQDIMNSLNPVFTIGRQMTETLRRHRRVSRDEAWAESAELLRRTGLRDAEDAMFRYPHQLSGGQRQRVMIAMALTCRPKLLIADEPTTALDVTIQLQIMQLLKSLRGETGMAILLITHDIGVVAEMADRVVVMYAGQPIERADCETLLAAPLHPYTRALLAAVPGLHDDRGRRLYAIPGAVPEDYPDMTGCRFAPRCAEAAGCPAAGRAGFAARDHWVRCDRALAGDKE